MNTHATTHLLPAVHRKSRGITDTFAVLRDMTRTGSVVPALPARRVQELLMAHDLLEPDAVTGRFDRRTCDAVARFQARHGLVVDGVPGTATSDLLLA